MRMLRSQGRHFTPAEIEKIISLLRHTDMTLGEIAERMRCTRGAIASVNRKYRIRDYAGRRNHWALSNVETEEAAAL